MDIDKVVLHKLREQVNKEQSEKLKAELEEAKAKFEEEKAKEQAEKEKALREEFEAQSKEAKKEKEELLEKLEKEEKEREKFEEKAKEEATKEARLEKLELEKKLKDTQLALEDAQRKAKQGSQQLQGEALELDLEEKLKSAFPGDLFLPIPKGVEGADIWQKVRFNGKEMGSIIWETKRTKAWANSWTTKLKEDAARVSATEAILATQVLPNGASGFDRKDGVWVTTYENALNICRFVRFFVTSISNAKSSASHSDEEWGQIRDYIMSDNFKHRMQAHFDAVNSLRDSLEAEKRAATLRWKKQEGQINKLDMNTVNFYGELKSIVSNLPELEEIETPLIRESIDENSNETLF